MRGRAMLLAAIGATIAAMPEPKCEITINVGLNRRRPGTRRRIDHKNVQNVVIACAPDDPALLQAVLNWVMNNHPGWSLTGYAPVEGS